MEKIIIFNFIIIIDNIICQLVANLPRPQCVKPLLVYKSYIYSKSIMI